MVSKFKFPNVCTETDYMLNNLDSLLHLCHTCLYSSSWSAESVFYGVTISIYQWYGLHYRSSLQFLLSVARPIGKGWHSSCSLFVPEFQIATIVINFSISLMKFSVLSIYGKTSSSVASYKSS